MSWRACEVMCLQVWCGVLWACLHACVCMHSVFASSPRWLCAVLLVCARMCQRSMHPGGPLEVHAFAVVCMSVYASRHHASMCECMCVSVRGLCVLKGLLGADMFVTVCAFTHTPGTVLCSRLAFLAAQGSWRNPQTSRG